MENKNSSLLINENHPFWLELIKYRENLLKFREKKSFNSFLMKLDLIVEEHNDDMRKLYYLNKDSFKEIFSLNSKFLDYHIKKEENLLTPTFFSRRIGSILQMFRPKFDNILADVVVHDLHEDFQDLLKGNVLQKALLYDYYFLNPNEEMKIWMKNDTNFAKILGLLLGVNGETLRSTLSKIKNKDIPHSKIQSKTKDLLNKFKIHF